MRSEFRNTGGVFTDVTEATAVAEPKGPFRDYQGLTLVDLDNDGLLDIALARLECSGDSSPNRVLRKERLLVPVEAGEPARLEQG